MNVPCVHKVCQMMSSIFPDLFPVMCTSKSGWWFGCHQFYFPRNSGLISSSQLTNSYFFQRGGPRTNQKSMPCLSPFLGDRMTSMKFGQVQRSAWPWKKRKTPRGPSCEAAAGLVAQLTVVSMGLPSTFTKIWEIILSHGKINYK